MKRRTRGPETRYVLDCMAECSALQTKGCMNDCIDEAHDKCKGFSLIPKGIRCQY